MKLSLIFEDDKLSEALKVSKGVRQNAGDAISKIKTRRKVRFKNKKEEVVKADKNQQTKGEIAMIKAGQRFTSYLPNEPRVFVNQASGPVLSKYNKMRPIGA